MRRGDIEEKNVPTQNGTKVDVFRTGEGDYRFICNNRTNTEITTDENGEELQQGNQK